MSCIYMYIYIFFFEQNSISNTSFQKLFSCSKINYNVYNRLSLFNDFHLHFCIFNIANCTNISTLAKNLLIIKIKSNQSISSFKKAALLARHNPDFLSKGKQHVNLFVMITYSVISLRFIAAPSVKEL